MPCSTVQEALSARLDGEREPVPALSVDAHRAACAECADWWQRASAQHAALRLQPQGLAPVQRMDLPSGRRSWRSRLADALRTPRAVELRAPEGARFGRRADHLRIAEEPPA